MKLQSTLLETLGLLLLSLTVFAQQVSKDSIATLNQQKETIEVSKKLNERKLDLAKLENELATKIKDAQSAQDDAQKSADENQNLAKRLSADSQNKGLANDANKAARKAERNARLARKATENLEGIQKDIASLKTKIADDESKLRAVAPAVTNAAPVVAPLVATDTVRQNSDTKSIQPTSQPVPGIVNGATTTAAPGQSVQSILESTYKSYPQQPGQPAIIINNIIIPSDYERSRQPDPKENLTKTDSEDLREYNEFKAWQRQKLSQENSANTGEVGNLPKNNVRSEYRGTENYPQSTSDRLTFRERFGERPARHSGLWVIPVVGIHASSFKADFNAGKADGRTGWNAGLDFRIHARRFFIQPGAHYFSSSMRITGEDSISNAPLLSGPRIHSLKVPVMLGLYLTKADRGFFKANVKAGATGTYLIAVDKSSLPQFNKNNIEEYSYGLNAGLGLEFGLLTIDISHEWGMTTVFKDNNAKNNILRATIGLKL